MFIKNFLNESLTLNKDILKNRIQKKSIFNIKNYINYNYIKKDSKKIKYGLINEEYCSKNLEGTKIIYTNLNFIKRNSLKISDFSKLSKRKKTYYKEIEKTKKLFGENNLLIGFIYKNNKNEIYYLHHTRTNLSSPELNFSCTKNQCKGTINYNYQTNKIINFAEHNIDYNEHIKRDTSRSKYFKEQIKGNITKILLVQENIEKVKIPKDLSKSLVNLFSETESCKHYIVKRDFNKIKYFQKRQNIINNNYISFLAHYHRENNYIFLYKTQNRYFRGNQIYLTCTTKDCDSNGIFNFDKNKFFIFNQHSEECKNHRNFCKTKHCSKIYLSIYKMFEKNEKLEDVQMIADYS